MHHLEEEAKQNGLELSISELATLANMAKNNIAEYGGFSPTQSLFGTAPMNWDRTEVAETPEERMQDTLYKQMIG